MNLQSVIWMETCNFKKKHMKVPDWTQLPVWRKQIFVRKHIRLYKIAKTWNGYE